MNPARVCTRIYNYGKTRRHDPDIVISYRLLDDHFLYAGANIRAGDGQLADEERARGQEP